MLSKARINLLCTVPVPLLVLWVGYLLFAGSYLFAFLPLAGIVLCMEARVRIGYRSRRGALFVFHLACAAGFIFALAYLAFASGEAVSLTPLTAAYATLAGMTLSGAVLIRRSWRPASLPARVV